MKKTVTKSYSLPVIVANEMEKIADEMHISGSAVATIGLTVSLALFRKATPEDMRMILNSLYGKKG